ncbi:MAG: TonB-dependent receptor [Gemmatimonadales bacterium]
MRRHTLSMSLLVLVFSAGPPSVASPQTLELASRGPRFIATGTAPGKALDASNAVVLRRRVSLDLSSVTTDEALKEITRQADLEISYSKSLLPRSRSVSLHAQKITVAAALTEVLLEAGIDVAVGRGGEMALVRRRASTMVEMPAVDSGAVGGRVTDDATGAPIAGATVIIEGMRRSATTESDGRYHIADIPQGRYTVRVRYIGYTPLVGSIIISAGAETTADFALAKSVQVLDEVVTTGTIVPTEIKALPTPITVVTDSEITLRRPNTLMDLFRQAVPTAVSWDRPTDPYFSTFAVRGANSLLAGNVSQMKVFLDGIEVAIPALAGVVPSSIERLEVIRGPQAAAIYGSDAIGGVIQIFTKRGDPTLERPEVGFETSVAAIQTPYDGGGALRPSLHGSLRGGGPDVSYTLLADYSRTGNWLSRQDASQSYYGASGGVRYTRGPITFDLSGRYNVYDIPTLSNPDLMSTGYIDFSRPYHRFQQITNQTLGARLSVAATRHWQHTLRVGIDQLANDLRQDSPRLITPEDTLLWVFNSHTTKSVLGYNTAVEGRLGRGVAGSLTAGFDYYRLPIAGFSSFGLLNTTGVLQPGPSMSIFANRTITENTGYFAQAQVGFRDALFVTGGLRAERNTSFGDSLGTPVAPRLGLSYVHAVGPMRLKLRGSWGRAIRAPDPGIKEGGQIGIFLNLPNPTLGPERQQGWDTGVDAIFGDRGSFSVTYYDQTADGLIQQVQDVTTDMVISQYQNVGRVSNTGIEVEGAITLGALHVKGQYGYARARVDQLVPNYAGDLQLRDQVPNTPTHTAGVSLSARPFPSATVAAGLTYVGSWREYDYFALFSCFGGTGPCQPTSRDYLVTYPGFAKFNVSVFRQIGPSLSGFASVDNLTNKKVAESSNIGPVWGRTTSIGLRFQY